MRQDFSVTDHGSIVLLNLHSAGAKDWVAENIEDGATQWAGALVIEPPFVPDIVAALEAEGLVGGC